MASTYRTSITLEGRGMRNMYRVEVIGPKGTALMWRRSLTDATASARKYAALFGAPCRVI